MGSDFDPSIVLTKIDSSIFYFSLHASITGLPPNEQFEYWFFYPDGRSHDGGTFASDKDGNLRNPQGLNDLGYGFESSNPIERGSYLLGIGWGKYDFKRQFNFENWKLGNYPIRYVRFTIDYEKVTMLQLEPINRAPRGQELIIRGSLWFRNERLRWSNGAIWLKGRKILISYNGKVTETYTDEFSTFSTVLEQTTSPYSIKAHYDGDEYFDQCDSNEVSFKLVKRRTQMSIKVDPLRIGKIGNIDYQVVERYLVPGQNYRIAGSIMDLDSGSELSEKEISLIFPNDKGVVPLISSSDGTFHLSGLTSPAEPGKYTVKALFGGDDLYESTKANVEFEVTEEKAKLPVKILTGTEIGMSYGQNELSVNPRIFYARDFVTNNDLCFVLMPLDRRFLRIFSNHTKPVLQQYFSEVITSDDIFTSTSILEDIWVNINTARLIVADVTDKNSNVFYELGIAHTIGKDIIVMTQNKNDVPFDINHIRYIEYTDDEEGWKRLELKLENFTEATVKEARSRKQRRVTKSLGQPDSLKEGIQYYTSRAEISLENLLSQAKKSVEMLALSFYNVTMNHISLIEQLIKNNVTVTFLVLDPSSIVVEERKKDFREGEELKHHIERTLINLCKLRRTLSENHRPNLRILTHQAYSSESIIIIDDGLIKVEEYGSLVDPHDRHSRLAFKRDNPEFFKRYYDYYHSIVPIEYSCKET